MKATMRGKKEEEQQETRKQKKSEGEMTEDNE
jgi:hypothetical protein